MRKSGFQAKRKKAFRPKARVNHPYTKKAPRLLRLLKLENDEVSKKNQVWVSDLTYIPAEAGYYYLVIVMDLLNREIRGWNVAHSTDAKNTRKVLIEAIQSTPGALQGLTSHSGRGVQYCSSAVREKLRIPGITQSMSRKGNCFDNAFAEMCNHDRLHYSLGYMSPIEYPDEQRCAA